ncbi:class II fructose-bisphosphate aldolase [Tessaracoccus massiliensis]|uniref:class II fructose-bisphosphate aldolase n=1 Tax=Tessaracoccus massiliensis TaxID=1522311 RepID=UPI0009455D29|nr:class II fructose-bisphosphate aldolase [Tessaracoccus massiliensis]
MASLLSAAEEGSYAVGAFNCSSVDQVACVVQTANELRSPVIVQAIAGMAPTADSTFWALARKLIELEAEVPVALHLDHGRTFEDCQAAVDAGFTSVMRDASRDSTTGEPLSLEANIAETLRVVELAKAAGVTVEGEIGTVGGGGEGTTGEFGAFDYAVTTVADALRFAQETKVDAMALAVGTSHGAVKFPPGQQPELHFELIEEVHGSLPHVALVLHGSSSVPPQLVERINATGGVVASSVGITVEDKKRAIQLGVRKINQGTDSHLGWTASAREHLSDRRGEVDPVGCLQAGMRGMSEAVAAAMRVFGSAGRV